MDRRILYDRLRPVLQERLGRALSLEGFEQGVLAGAPAVVDALLRVVEAGPGALRTEALDALNDLRNPEGVRGFEERLPALLEKLLEEPTPWYDPPRGGWVETLYLHLTYGPVKEALRRALIELRRRRPEDPHLRRMVASLLIVDRVQPDGRIDFLPT